MVHLWVKPTVYPQWVVQRALKWVAERVVLWVKPTVGLMALPLVCKRAFRRAHLRAVHLVMRMVDATVEKLDEQMVVLWVVLKVVGWEAE